LVFLLGGIGSLVFGVGQAVGAIEGEPLAPILVGIPAALIGVLIMRRMSGGAADAPFPSPESLGDHSLTGDSSTASPPPALQTDVPNDPTATAIRAGRRVAILAALAVLGIGAAVAFVAVAESESPNVAQHILEACADALRVAEGPSASFGQATGYESVGLSFEEIHFETSQGWTWTCTYDLTDGTALAGPVVRP